MSAIPFKVTINFPGGVKKKRKTYNLEREIMPYLIMRLKSQYPAAEIEWEDPQGIIKSTNLAYERNSASYG